MTQQQEVLTLFYLCYCKLNHIFPDRQRTKGLDISQLYQISVYHDIGAIVCMALESAGILDNAIRKRRKHFGTSGTRVSAKCSCWTMAELKSSAFWTKTRSGTCP